MNGTRLNSYFIHQIFSFHAIITVSIFARTDKTKLLTMGSCCGTKQDKSETTPLLDDQASSKINHKESSNAETSNNVIEQNQANDNDKPTITDSTSSQNNASDQNLESKTDTNTDNPSQPVQVFKASTNNITTIPSIEDNHFRFKIHSSIFINHWFRISISNPAISIPDIVISIISNYIIKQNISSILYIQPSSKDPDPCFNIDENQAILSVDTEDKNMSFNVDAIYKDATNLFDTEIKALCNDFLNGYDSALITFGNGGISKDVSYKNFQNQTGLLYECIEFILKELLNCVLFIKIYGIVIDDNNKEKYIDLLRIGGDVTVKNQFENKMLLNMDGFIHLMQQYTHYYNQYQREYKNKDIIVIFELSLQTIMNNSDENGDDGINVRFGNLFDPVKDTNNILAPLVIKMSNFKIVVLGNVNAINLIENTPNSPLFRQLSNKIRMKNQSLLNMMH